MQAFFTFFALQIFDSFGHFERIADGCAQNLIHIGQNCGGSGSGQIGNPGYAAGKFAGRIQVGHESAVAAFQVHNQAIESGGKFFGKNRGGYQRYGFNRAANVAQGIDLFVGRCQVAGLSDNGAADVFNRLGEQFVAGESLVPGNGIKLVQGAAGVAKTAAGNHRNVSAASRNQRRKHKADFVADAAGGMFVDNRAVKAAPMQDIARIAHGQG